MKMVSSLYRRRLAGPSLPAFDACRRGRRRYKPLSRIFAIPFLLLCVFGVTAQAQNSETMPPELQGVAIEQRLDQQLPLDVPFRDEQGKQVLLGQFFKDKPVILNFVYYECPMLCTEVLNGLVRSLKVLQFTPGKEFEILTISFDTRDTPPLASAKKETYLQEYGRPAAGKGWHFLTGTEPSIRKVTAAAGFGYKWIPENQQFAHAAGIMIVTPQGKLARYFYGIDYSARDIRLALVEASQNKIGTPTDALLLYCFHYDPKTARYSATVVNFVRAGGVLTLLGLGILVVKMNASNKRKSRSAANEEEGHVS